MNRRARVRALEAALNAPDDRRPRLAMFRVHPELFPEPEQAYFDALKAWTLRMKLRAFVLDRQRRAQMN